MGKIFHTIAIPNNCLVQYLLKLGVVCHTILHYLCSVNKKKDQLPEAGAILYVMPMMIEDGTGSPARVFAILP